MRAFSFGNLIMAGSILFTLGFPAMHAADSKTSLRADAKEVTAYLSTLPVVEIPGLTQERAMALVAMPLACIDHPHAAPEQRTDYLWTHESRAHLLDTYASTRSFYGCADWHSA